MNMYVTFFYIYDLDGCIIKTQTLYSLQYLPTNCTLDNKSMGQVRFDDNPKKRMSVSMLLISSQLCEIWCKLSQIGQLLRKPRRFIEEDDTFSPGEKRWSVVFASTMA